MRAELFREGGQMRALILVMRRAELAPTDERDSREARTQAFFEQFEDFVAAEDVVPQLGDLLAVQVSQAGHKGRDPGLPLTAGPDHIVARTLFHHASPAKLIAWTLAKLPRLRRIRKPRIPALHEQWFL